MSSKLRPRRWIRVLTWAFGIFTMFILAIILLDRWSCFHPTYSYPIVGPAGPRHRAFIADVGGFGLCELLVSASDWPHTFSAPFVLGDVFRADLYDAAAIFWTQDGSALVLRVKPHGQAAEIFEAAYDFQAHTPLSHCSAQIAALIQARGGLGPKSDAYSDDRVSQAGPDVTIRSGR